MIKVMVKSDGDEETRALLSTDHIVSIVEIDGETVVELVTGSLYRIPMSLDDFVSDFCGEIQ